MSQSVVIDYRIILTNDIECWCKLEIANMQIFLFSLQIGFEWSNCIVESINMKKRFWMFISLSVFKIPDIFENVTFWNPSYTSVIELSYLSKWWYRVSSVESSCIPFSSDKPKIIRMKHPVYLLNVKICLLGDLRNIL